MEFKMLASKYSGLINQGIWNKLIIERARDFQIYFNYTDPSEVKQKYIIRQGQQQIEAVKEFKDSKHETRSMEIETSTAVSTAYSQSSSSSSITSFNAPDTALFLPSVQLLHGNIGREYSIEDDCDSFSGESIAQFDYSFSTNLKLSNKTSLVTYDNKKDFSRNEDSIFFKMLDQLNLIDLVRLHQSIDQGSFRKAAPPLSRPINLGLPEKFAKENAWLYSCVWFHRLRFKFAKGHEDCLRQNYSTEIRGKQAPMYIRSPLSNCVRPEDITDLTLSKISIKFTSRHKSCSQSEPYISLLTKQCEQVNSLIIDTSFLERAKYEKFHNLDKEEIEKEDHYDNDEIDEKVKKVNDNEDKYVGDYDHHSDSDSDIDADMDMDINIDSDSDSNWNSNWDSNNDREENYLGLKRLTEFLIGYHENDLISNKKLCRGHNIKGVGTVSTLSREFKKR